MNFAELDYISKEDSFMLKQVKIRAEIRMNDNRPKPIDRIIMGEDPSFIDVLSEKDKLELKEELDNLQELEKNKLLLIYYKQMDVFMKKVDNGIIQETDISALSKLELDVEQKLKGETLDFEYWQGILSEIQYKKSKLIIMDIYQYLKNKPKKEKLKQAQMVKKKINLIQEPFESDMEPILTREVLVKDSKKRIVDEKEDMLKLQLARKRLRQQLERSWKSVPKQDTPVNISQLSSFDENFLENGLSDLHVDEQLFISQPLINKKTPDYPPFQTREPLYIVRILSKRGGTASDVRGYQFYLSYEMLMDKSIPPTFRIDTDPKLPDSRILIFTGGAPYYDIAFQIVGKEWELNQNKGYISEFTDFGVLKLCFQFKK